MTFFRIALVAAVAATVAAGTAVAGGGSPFNGHYVGKSADGRHLVDINVNGGSVRSTGLKLACPKRPGFGDFDYRAAVTRTGQFTASVSGVGSGRPVTLRISAQIARGVLRGTMTARIGSCTIGPVKFTLRRQGE